MTINEFKTLDVIASTKRGEPIAIVVEQNNGEIITIELTKRNANWLSGALKAAKKLREWK